MIRGGRVVPPGAIASPGIAGVGLAAISAAAGNEAVRGGAPVPVNYGVAVMNRDQIAVSFDFFDPAGPNWYDLGDGGAVLDGTFQNFFVRGNEAYLTTRDDASKNTTGLFYCADISAALLGGATWVLLVSAAQAEIDTDYTWCHIGSMWMNNDGDVCVATHSNNPPAGNAGVYVGNGGIVAYQDLPLAGGGPIWCALGTDGCLHCVGSDSGGAFYIAGRAGGGWAGVAHEVDGASIDFEPPITWFAIAAHAGHIESWNNHGGFNLFGGGTWDPTSSDGLIQVRAGMGIKTDYQGSESPTPYLYSNDDVLYDLYLSGGVGMIGDANVDFGFWNDQGGDAEFYPNDLQRIVWVLGTPNAFVNTNVVLYTEDQGLNWIPMDGVGATSLQNALGGVANWSGWSSVQEANSRVRVFPHSL